jgi:hypothetical protein
MKTESHKDAIRKLVYVIFKTFNAFFFLDKK